jgi:hypothetical protein
MKKVEKFLLGMVIGFGICMVLSTLTSCNRYVRESNNGECGVWYPKKCKIGTKNW